MRKQTCPEIPPDALWVARLTADGAIFTGLAGVVIALFRSQVDRLRARFARSVTAVIGIDEETRSMIRVIAGTSDSSTLVVITDGPDEPGRNGGQNAGRPGGVGRPQRPGQSDDVVAVAQPRAALPYVARSADQSGAARHDHPRAVRKSAIEQRLPLTVRVDDPWQAEAWRAEQLGGTDTRWAADAVGKYEVTARWLLENIIATQHDSSMYSSAAHRN